MEMAHLEKREKQRRMFDVVMLFYHNEVSRSLRCWKSLRSLWPNQVRVLCQPLLLSLILYYFRVSPLSYQYIKNFVSCLAVMLDISGVLKDF